MIRSVQQNTSLVLGDRLADESETWIRRDPAQRMRGNAKAASAERGVLCGKAKEKGIRHTQPVDT